MSSVSDHGAPLVPRSELPESVSRENVIDVSDDVPKMLNELDRKTPKSTDLGAMPMVMDPAFMGSDKYEPHERLMRLAGGGGFAASGASCGGGHLCTVKEAAAIKGGLMRGLWGAGAVDENDLVIDYVDGFHIFYCGCSEVAEEYKAGIIKNMFDIDFTVPKIKIPDADLPKLTNENISGYEHILNNIEADPNRSNSA
jgi:hypothetical protein